MYVQYLLFSTLRDEPNERIFHRFSARFCFCCVRIASHRIEIDLSPIGDDNERLKIPDMLLRTYVSTTLVQKVCESSLLPTYVVDLFRTVTKVVVYIMGNSYQFST